MARISLIYFGKKSKILLLLHKKVFRLYHSISVTHFVIDRKAKETDTVVDGQNRHNCDTNGTIVVQVTAE